MGNALKGKKGSTKKFINGSTDDASPETVDPILQLVPGSVNAPPLPSESQSGQDIQYNAEKSVIGSLVDQQVIALYNCTKRFDFELSFEQGDYMTVIEELDENFAKARLQKNKKKVGYIPLSYVCPVWYYGNISRKKAEIALMNPDNHRGSYLLRDSKNHSGLAVSVKVENNGQMQIKHFRIERTSEGKFLVKRQMQFDTAFELLLYYSRNPLNRSVLLEFPCIRTFEKYDLSDTTRDRWAISHSQIRKDKRIGGGNFGEVFLGTYIGNGPNGERQEALVAVKTMRKDRIGVKEFLEEAACMKNLQHINIVPLFAVCTEKDPYYIVLQYMDKGSLLDVLLKHDPLISCFNDKIDMLYQISCGMKYLENKQIVHRDLAARNILVNKKKICKIADFGLATQLTQGICEQEQGVKFPIKWSAPEVITHRQYTTKSDVWSFGIVMMEVIKDGETPYHGFSNQETVSKLEKGYRMPKPNACCPWLYEKIILMTWAEDPANRPTFASLMDSLSNYDPHDTTDYTIADNIN